LKRAAHNLKVSADYGNASGQYQWVCLLGNEISVQDVQSAIRYFRLSAEKGNPARKTIVGWRIENGIRTPMNVTAAAQSSEFVSDQSPEGTFFISRCYQTR
jgi:hypothetical protein